MAMKKTGDELLYLSLDEVYAELYIVKERLPKKARSDVSKALALAEVAHTGQARDDDSPYIAHPLRVALSLAWELHVWDHELLCAALLHDTSEDAQQITIADISATFGERVGEIVRVLTKPDQPAMTDTQINQRYFEDLLNADEDCKLVKLADKLDNVRDALNSPDLEKRKRTAAEARDFYLKLAESLSDVRRRGIILALLQEAIKALEHQTAIDDKG